jgi:folate-binding protein YgfZ
MVKDLRTQQLAQGAIFDERLPVPLSFGQDDTARQAAMTGAALCDRSHWGRLRITGGDRLRFLHNQTTNNIQALQPGQGRDTVFVTSTARTLDLATAYVEADGVLLLVSPGQAENLSAWMDRYIFPADQVAIADETASTVAFSLIGPTSNQILAQLGIEIPAEAPMHSHQRHLIAATEVLVAIGSGLALPGFTLITPSEHSDRVWDSLTATGATPLGETVWEQLRIQQGRPLPGQELTPDYNPLEAGLWHAVSFDKGCYIGQETIARLNTYQGVKQQLRGLKLAQWAPPGTSISWEDTKVGILTSCVSIADGAVGLGYIRTKAGGKQLAVKVGDQPAEVLDLPFATRGYLTDQPTQ